VAACQNGASRRRRLGLNYSLIARAEQRGGDGRLTSSANGPEAQQRRRKKEATSIAIAAPELGKDEEDGEREGKWSGGGEGVF
jgi:hypothetical protein